MDAKEIIDSVRDQIEKSSSVRAVFGEPIQANNALYVPVASIRLAGGGGGGAQPEGVEGKPAGTGMGLGIKASATPVGFIEITDDGAKMVDVIDKNKVAVGGLIIGGVLLLTLVKMSFWKMKHA